MTNTTYAPVNTQDHQLKILSLKAYQLKLRLRNVELELSDIIGEQAYQNI